MIIGDFGGDKDELLTIGDSGLGGGAGVAIGDLVMEAASAAGGGGTGDFGDLGEGLGAGGGGAPVLVI